MRANGLRGTGEHVGQRMCLVHLQQVQGIESQAVDRGEAHALVDAVMCGAEQAGER